MNKQLEEFKKRGFGLILQEPRKADAVFGKIFPKFKGIAKNWIPFAPVKRESQFNSQFCTNFSYTNCIETMTNRMMFENGLEQYNFSDRWNAVKSGTNPATGNTLQNVCYAGLKEGNILEEECPWENGWLNSALTFWNEISDLSKVNPKQIYLGPNYSLVGTSIDELKTALALSPLQIGIIVGETYSDEIITKPKQQYGGHAVELLWIDDKYKYIFDTSEPFIKKLALDYPILVAMSFAPLPLNWEELNKKDIPIIQKKIIELAKQVINYLSQAINLLLREKTMPKSTQEMPKPTQPEPNLPISEPPIPPKYIWSNQKDCRHSCRMIMDEENISWADKDLLCACIMQESEFNPRAIGRVNSNGTQDWGLAQFNNGKNKQGVPYWIGEGAAFKDVDEVLSNPEKNVRILIREFKNGNLKYWSSYSTKAYLKWMSGDYIKLLKS